MTRVRKLLHIWPIEYSGRGSRGLQTVSFSVYSTQAKLLVWTPGEEWVRRHRAYELTLWTNTKFHIYLLLFLKNLTGLKMSFCLFGNILALLVLWGTNDSFGGNASLMHPTAHASTQSYKSLGATIALLFGQQP